MEDIKCVGKGFCCELPDYIELYEIKNDGSTVKLTFSNSRAVSAGEIKAYFSALLQFRKVVYIESKEFNLYGFISSIKQINKKVILTVTQ